MKISVIIRCRNEEKHIGRLLAGIMEQTVIAETEIIIVDSGSTDATLAIAQQFPCEIIHIKPEDFSFGYALNVGCEAATGDILVFASAHVYPLYRDWLELLRKPFIEEESIGVVYGKQRGNEITKYSEHQIFAAWFPEKSTMDQQHPFCNNANCAIRKSLWEERPYDETLTGLEDLAWAKEHFENGGKIAYQSEATIVHVHEEPWSSVFNRYRREAIALRLIMKTEKFNIFTFLSLLWKNLLSDWRHAIKDGVFWKEFFSIWRFRFNQFYGTYRGYKESYLLDNKVRERFYYPKGTITKKGADPKKSSRRIDYSQLDNGREANV